MLKRLLLPALVAGLLAACTAQESFQNAEQCGKVEVGMTQEQVRALMGAPTGNDPAADGTATWSYLFGSATDTQPIKIMFGPDGRVSGKLCAPEAQGSHRPDSDDQGAQHQ